MEILKVEKTFTESGDYNGLQGFNKDITVISQYPKNCPVYIHYKDNDVWNDVAMKLKLVKDDFCIWEYHDEKALGFIGATKGLLPEETDIAIFQDTPEGRVWNNNYWNNYHLGPCDGPYLAQGVGVSLFSATLLSDGDFSGSVFVSNLGYQKNVTIVYMTDKVKTVGSFNALFCEEYTVDIHSYVQSPNVNNCEIFTFQSNIGECRSVEFYITYEVNGQFFIDNNRGQNYVVKRQK
jgi:hypothetical protein